MKNLKKLTKKNLKNINGGAEKCPPLASWCTEWCTWSAWQKVHCLNAVLDVMPCDC
ncbi:bacteriocin-like protein [Chryseobacterium ginsenosidimutans]|uniref:bacteriocin-like protein n=1 Tax=Chryseobacterium ginsenosidimutans TaxID=687846 RepID=UPI002788175C|nr:bacteriocin [Chryseobacterium ginsenosidimutans]MDQ0592087.1 bacteriocin-like protein [Chryseobacterium ginsenosidimutans]